MGWRGRPWAGANFAAPRALVENVTSDTVHAFEDLVDRLLRRQGYWTSHSVKVTLTADDKHSLGKPSLPRPELDLIAYRPASNVLALIECKSYLDSTGVTIAAFNGTNLKFAERFRLFTDKRFRVLITDRVLEQLAATGSIPLETPSVEYWLVAGRIAPHSFDPLTSLFEQQPGWVLKDRTWIAECLQAMGGDAYEDDIVTMAMKLSKSTGSVA